MSTYPIAELDIEIDGRMFTVDGWIERTIPVDPDAAPVDVATIDWLSELPMIGTTPVGKVWGAPRTLMGDDFVSAMTTYGDAIRSAMLDDAHGESERAAEERENR